MDKNTTRYGADLEGVTKLLSIGVGHYDQHDMAGGGPKAELLRARFAGPLPPETCVVEMLPTLLANLCGELLPLGGKPLQDVLLDNQTSLRLIRKIKEYGKKLGNRAEPEHTVGIAVYYVAIASALLFHDDKITRHSYRYLADSLDVLDTEWMSPKLAAHISKARQLCRSRAEQ
jgi:hypothetical protein